MQKVRPIPSCSHLPVAARMTWLPEYDGMMSRFHCNPGARRISANGPVELRYERGVEFGVAEG